MEPGAHLGDHGRPQVLIITGGSRGIGAATALLVARQGSAVCVNYIHARARADEVVSAIRNEGGPAIAIQAVVSAESDVVRLFEATGAPPGGPTALVNNAATLENQMRPGSIDRACLEFLRLTCSEASYALAKPCDECLSGTEDLQAPL